MEVPAQTGGFNRRTLQGPAGSVASSFGSLRTMQPMVRKSYSMISSSGADDPAAAEGGAPSSFQPAGSHDKLRISHLDAAARERHSNRGSGSGGPAPPAWAPPPPPRDGSGDYV